MPRNHGVSCEVGSPGSPEAELRHFLSSLPFEGSRVLVALSGGPDSTALLLAASKALGSEAVAACWVDHGLRPRIELELEERLVATLCDRLGVRLHVQRCEPGSLARAASASGGIEAAARAFRYEALERARRELSSDLILTGHNADDLVETMLMRLCTGSGSSGLRGIPRLRGRVGRPFLRVGRQDILAYLDGHGLAYSSDSTNASDDYLRNRVRHHVVPPLQDAFPGLRTALALAAEKAALDDEALEELASGLVVASEPGAPSLDAAAFDEAHVAVRARALYRLCLAAGRSRTPWRLVLAAARSGKRSGCLASGAGIDFLRRADRVLVQATERQATSEAVGPWSRGFSLVASGFGVYRIGKELECTIYSRDRAPGLRLDAFDWPLCIRSRRPGDSIHASGGRKMLDDLATESRPGALPDIVMEDVRGVVAWLPRGDAAAATYRSNDGLSAKACAYLGLDLKGAIESDAIRR